MGSATTAAWRARRGWMKRLLTGFVLGVLTTALLVAKADKLPVSVGAALANGAETPKDADAAKGAGNEAPAK